MQVKIRALLLFAAYALFNNASIAQTNAQATVTPYWHSSAAYGVSLDSLAINTVGAAVVPLTPGSNGINYYGGPVMTGTINVYIVWYGAWAGDTSTTIVPAFLNALGGSSYFNIDTSYYNTYPASVTGRLHLAATTTDAYSQGYALTDAKTQAVVTSAISSGRLPTDANGVYFVLTSADVTATDPQNDHSCVQMCGYHAHATIAGIDAKYAWVGNTAACPTTCSPVNANASPNGNVGADGMVNIISHELDETANDPDINAWFTSTVNGKESADLCNFVFANATFPEFIVANGSYANVTLAGKNYLIQANWLNSQGGLCAFPKQLITDSASVVMEQQPLFYGYRAGLSGTSMTPSSTSNGHPYQSFFTQYALRGGGIEYFFVVGGFAADPGQGWLVSVSSPGLTLSGSSTSTYSYSSSTGNATWGWLESGTTLLSSGASTIVHN